VVVTTIVHMFYEYQPRDSNICIVQYVSFLNKL